MRLKISYNAPLILSYTILCFLLTGLDTFMGGNLSYGYFSVHSQFDSSNFLSYFRLISHVFGHENWTHLVANFSLILLIGPILEEKYGSKLLFIMIIVTAVATGILNIAFFDTGLMGASGIVFMMIILGSFTNIQSGQIPITFILVILIYLSKEVVSAFETDSISQFAHIVGGILGSLFGFALNKRRSRNLRKIELEEI